MEKQKQKFHTQKKKKGKETKPKKTGIVCEGSLTMPSHLLNIFHSASDRP